GYAGAPQALRVQVISNGTTVINQVLNTNTITTNNTTWVQQTLNFTALGTTTQVIFSDASSITTGVDLLLDAISFRELMPTTPTVLTLLENSANGTTVATFAGTDPDAGQTASLTYSLTDNAGGRFAINSSTGVVTVADSGLLDFESATTHNITVRVTDAGGLTRDLTQAITVINVNEAPNTLTLASGGSIAENSANGTTVATFAGTDPDAGETATLTYTLTDNAGGRFTINSSTGIVTVANSSLLDFETNTTHNITVRVTDAGGLTRDLTQAITVTNVNEAPNTLTLASGGSIAENSANGTTVATFAGTDPDAGQTATLTYSLTNNAGGRFAINSSTGVVTVADSNLLDFESATTHNITVRVTDAGGLTRDLTQNITVTNVNDAPNLLGVVTGDNLLINPSFENLYTINQSGSWNGYNDGTILQGWNRLAGDFDQIDSVMLSPTPLTSPTHGNYFLEFEGSSGQHLTISQTVSGLTPGSTYQLSFDTRDFGTGSGDSISVFWGGQLLQTITDSMTGYTWTSYRYQVLADAGDGTNTLRIVGAGPSDSNGMALDNMSLRQVLPSMASAIAIANAGFDVQTVADGASGFANAVDSWTGNGSIANPSAAQLATQATSGNNVAHLLNGHLLSQTLTETLSQDTVYTLTVNVGDRLDFVVTNNAIRLYAGSTLLASTIDVIPSNGAWQTAVLRFNSTSLGTGSPLYGQALKIELENTATSTSFVGFDDVRLTKAPAISGVLGTVAENSANGTTVATFAGTDPDAGQTAFLTYSLTNNAGGRFTINGTTGVVTVANSRLLDFETNTTHSITVRVTDTGGLTRDLTQAITITDVTGESLVGTSGNDILRAGIGNDTLNGLAGNDTLIGGVGDDTYNIDSFSDVVTENVGEGTDLVQVNGNFNYTLANNVENVTNITSNNLMLTGNTLNNVITSGTGNDTLVGGLGSDTYNINSLSDVVTENAGEGIDEVRLNVALNYTLGSNLENLRNITSTGTTLTGNALHNVIASGAGNDTLVGGLGNDTYTINSLSDVVTENAGEGTDLVQVNGNYNYTLANNVENVTNITSNNLMLTGNTLNNVITSSTGNDTLVGGLGNDTYVINSSSDVVTELTSEGTDEVQVNGNFNYTLTSNVENVTNFTTNSLQLTGNTLDNVLTSSAGNDTLAGGTGNDTYVINSSSDMVIEGVGAGIDEVRVNGNFNYTLGSNLENLTNITGAGRTLTGNTLNNLITSGTGVDTMVGGLGDDTYVVNNTGDVVTENASEGTDEVRLAGNFNYTLGSNLENLTNTTSTGRILTGNALNNLITSGTGIDTMVGGLGDDTYVIDSLSDVVTENAGEGIDEVRVNGNFNYTLANNVENGRTLFAIAASNLIGNTLNNTLYGNAFTGGMSLVYGGLGNDTLYAVGLNTLYGEDGNDTLYAVNGTLAYGGNNNDLLYGGTGSSTLYGEAGNDTLTSAMGGDTLDGGDGDDVLISNVVENASFNTRTDTLISGAGNDVLVGGNFMTQQQTGNMLIQLGLNGGNDTLTGTQGSLTPVIAESVKVVLDTSDSVIRLAFNNAGTQLDGSSTPHNTVQVTIEYGSGSYSTLQYMEFNNTNNTPSSKVVDVLQVATGNTTTSYYFTGEKIIQIYQAFLTYQNANPGIDISNLGVVRTNIDLLNIIATNSVSGVSP
ncbi:MAG: beta strand repeat-containing protein, partial [Vampirovibrionales bacterium]